MTPLERSLWLGHAALGSGSPVTGRRRAARVKLTSERRTDSLMHRSRVTRTYHSNHQSAIEPPPSGSSRYPGQCERAWTQCDTSASDDQRHRFRAARRDARVRDWTWPGGSDQIRRVRVLVVNAGSSSVKLSLIGDGNVTLVSRTTEVRGLLAAADPVRLLGSAVRLLRVGDPGSRSVCSGAAWATAEIACAHFVRFRTGQSRGTVSADRGSCFQRPTEPVVPVDRLFRAA